VSYASSSESTSAIRTYQLQGHTDSRPDGHVDLGILDRLHDECGIITVGPIKT